MAYLSFSLREHALLESQACSSFPTLPVALKTSDLAGPKKNSPGRVDRPADALDFFCSTLHMTSLATTKTYPKNSPGWVARFVVGCFEGPLLVPT
jgi:hypothetical protein